MGIFHQHTWETVNTEYTPGAVEISEFSGRGSAAVQLMRDLVYGYTLVTQKCSGCGKANQIKMTGKWEDK